MDFDKIYRADELKERRAHIENRWHLHTYKAGEMAHRRAEDAYDTFIYALELARALNPAGAHTLHRRVALSILRSALELAYAENCDSKNEER